MAKKILITGGAGYIGSHTALELLNKDMKWLYMTIFAIHQKNH